MTIIIYTEVNGVRIPSSYYTIQVDTTLIGYRRI